MEDINDFYDLNVWKLAHKQSIDIYKATTSFPKTETYSLVDQIRRAATSVSANIAEGYGRHHSKDRLRFLFLSRGSNKEVQNFLLVSKDLGYLKQNVFGSLWSLSKDVEKLINGYAKAVKRLK